MCASEREVLNPEFQELSVSLLKLEMGVGNAGCTFLPVLREACRPSRRVHSRRGSEGGKAEGPGRLPQGRPSPGHRLHSWYPQRVKGPAQGKGMERTLPAGWVCI